MHFTHKDFIMNSYEYLIFPIKYIYYKIDIMFN